MKIDKVTFRNFGSYGNKTQTIELPEDPGFYMISGKNGGGKCLMPSTRLKISFKSKEELENFKSFLVTRNSN